jgi:hypothetical protein
MSPYHFVFGQKPRIPMDNVTHPIGTLDWNDITENMVQVRGQDITNLRDYGLIRQANIVSQENERCPFADPITYEVGDVVLLWRSSLEKQWSKKLDEKWAGPYVVSECMDGGVYRLQHLDGTDLNSGTGYNHRRLKLYRLRDNWTQ